MRFAPEPVPYTDDWSFLREYLGRTMGQISNSFESIELIELPELNNPPTRAQDGMIKFADGTNWDPGSGRGFYAYRDADWFKLDLDATDNLEVNNLIVNGTATFDTTITVTGLATFSAGISVTGNGSFTGNLTVTGDLTVDDITADEGTFDELTATSLRLTATTDATPTSTDHPLQIGSTAGNNLRADANEIQTVNNGVASTLQLNPHGGRVDMSSTDGASSYKLRLDSTVDIGLGATDHALQIGDSSGLNLRFDNNEIQQVNNAATDTLGINLLGGDVSVGDTATIFTLLGGKLKFPAVQQASADANTLDDYEEGDWTPGIAFGGNSTNLTYGLRNGKYVKIGDWVWVAGRVTLTNKGISTGTATITSSPFLPSVIDIGTGACGVHLAMAGLTSPIYILATTTAITPRDSGAITTVALDDTNFTNTSDLIFCCMFRI